MSLQAIQQVASGLMRNVTFQFNVADVPAGVLRWIMANPGQTALGVCNTAVIFTPAALTGPLLQQWVLALQVLLLVSLPGVRHIEGSRLTTCELSGSVAAWLQPIFGNVVAHGLFATLQSAAMGGYGVATVNGLAQAGAVVSGGLTAWYSVLAGRGWP